MSGALSKLAELRTRTDRELAGIIDRQLDFVFIARDPKAAEEAYVQACRLLRFVEDSNERRRLELKVKRFPQPAASYAVAGL
jgi:hypothetical protein